MPGYLRPFIAATTLVLVLAPQARGQAPTIGLKLGPSISTIRSDESASTRSLTRFTGGGFVRFDFGRIGFQPELMYSPKGGRDRLIIDDFPTDIDAELRLDYIEIPLLLILPLATGPRMAPYLYGGPALAFEVGCNVVVKAGGVSASSGCDDDELESDRRTFDVGAMLGGGLAFPIGPGSLLIEGRYNFGLLDLNTGPDGGAFRNRAGAVLVGYALTLAPRVRP